MRAIKGSWTGPERRVQRALAGKDLEVQPHREDLPGRPDFLVRGKAPRRRRVAVFVEGCFFHGCLLHYKRPKSNRTFWDKKLRDNRRRDLRNARKLRRLGFRVARVWEHSTRGAALVKAVLRVERMANP